MIRFAAEHSTAVKVANKNAIGFINCFGKLVVYYRGMYMDFAPRYEIEKSEFEQMILVEYNRLKKQYKNGRNW